MFNNFNRKMNIALSMSGSGTKGIDQDTGEEYEKVNGEWKAVKKEKLQNIKRK